MKRKVRLRALYELCCVCLLGDLAMALLRGPENAKSTYAIIMLGGEIEPLSAAFCDITRPALLLLLLLLLFSLLLILFWLWRCSEEAGRCFCALSAMRLCSASGSSKYRMAGLVAFVELNGTNAMMVALEKSFLPGSFFLTRPLS